jgi:hypothetical protein
VKTLDWKHVFLVVVGKNGLLAFALDVVSQWTACWTGQDVDFTHWMQAQSRHVVWYIYILLCRRGKSERVHSIAVSTISNRFNSDSIAHLIFLFIPSGKLT